MTEVCLSKLHMRVSDHQPTTWTAMLPSSANADGNEGTTSRIQIANETLAAIDEGAYVLNGLSYNLVQSVQESQECTKYYSPDSVLETWASSLGPQSQSETKFNFDQISTLDCARRLADLEITPLRIGVLNFASAMSPGGRFLDGSPAQEESLARSSTLYASLTTEVAKSYYTLHRNRSKGAFYTHAMIYSPNVILFRDDGGAWKEPVRVDVLTSPAVNAGVARRHQSVNMCESELDNRITECMKERMARILFLFERESVRHLVLGSFGTGAFGNKVDMVARLWAELLAAPTARFRNSFDQVEFAILGKETFEEFSAAFDSQMSFSSFAREAD